MKLLIIDDEQFTRDGLQLTIGHLFPDVLQLPPSCNGLEGFSAISENRPDIIITDIRMPVLDGLDLIEKVYSMEYDCEFVIVSGYDNFEYATRAMKMGVKHYILKPCKDTDIKKEISLAIADVNKRKRMREFFDQAKRDQNIVASQIKQQLLNSLIFGDGYTSQEILRYHTEYGFIPTSIRLFIVSGDDDGNLNKALILKHAVDQILTDHPMSISTLLGDKIIFVIDSGSCYDIENIGQNIIHFCNCYNMGNIYVAISNSGKMEQISLMYRQTLKYLEYRFFADGSLVITSSMCSNNGITNEAINLGGIIDTIVQTVLLGQTDHYRELLSQFFDFLRSTVKDISLARTYCFELLIALVRNNGDKLRIDSDMKKIMNSMNVTTLNQYQSLICEVIYSLELKNSSDVMHDVIKLSMQYIETHLCDANLSVSVLATDVLFIRPDYFGKLFKKEVGMKPSSYIRDRRIEQAKKLLIEGGQKISSVCTSCGFGDNVQYFCYIFKQSVGYTPSQYRDNTEKHKESKTG